MAKKLIPTPKQRDIMEACSILGKIWPDPTTPIPAVAALIVMFIGLHQWDGGTATWMKPNKKVARKGR